MWPWIIIAAVSLAIAYPLELLAHRIRCTARRNRIVREYDPWGNEL